MQQERKHGILFHVLDVVFNIIVIVAIVAAIRTFLVSPFQVEGNSMLSTLTDKEYIIINKLAYFVGDPKRGDIVVFHPPNDPGKYYVKRVIGEPGDTVVIKGGMVFLKTPDSREEVQIDESSYLGEQNRGHTYRHPPNSENTDPVEYKVPEGHYFVLGDNRRGSFDSRSFASDPKAQTPYVDREAIKGRVWFVALPITKLHALEMPTYDL